MHRSNAYIAADFTAIAACVDGKTMKCGSWPSNSYLHSALMSSKDNHEAFLGLTWNSETGMNVEHTSPFLGRNSETGV
jgi:hypothetical protein